MKNLKPCCRCGTTVDLVGKIFRRRRAVAILDEKSRRACVFCVSCARGHKDECKEIAARLFKQLEAA